MTVLTSTQQDGHPEAALAPQAESSGPSCRKESGAPLWKHLDHDESCTWASAPTKEDSGPALAFTAQYDDH